MRVFSIILVMLWCTAAVDAAISPEMEQAVIAGDWQKVYDLLKDDSAAQGDDVGKVLWGRARVIVNLCPNTDESTNYGKLINGNGAYVGWVESLRTGAPRPQTWEFVIDFCQQNPNFSLCQS